MMSVCPEGCAEHVWGTYICTNSLFAEPALLVLVLVLVLVLFLASTSLPWGAHCVADSLSSDSARCLSPAGEGLACVPPVEDREERVQRVRVVAAREWGVFRRSAGRRCLSSDSLPPGSLSL